MGVTMLAVFGALVVADVGEYVPAPELLQPQEQVPKDDQIEPRQNGPRNDWKWTSPCLDIEKCRT